MTALSDNSNLPEIFRKCDDRVFSFGRDKLPHKDKPINAIKYSDMFDAISAACRLGSKNQSQSIPLFLHWMLSKCRKWQIGTDLYVWPYECRFDSNESIGQGIYMSDRGLRRIFIELKNQNLISRNGTQKDPNRTYCFGPQLINIAKMAQDKRFEYIQVNMNHGQQLDKRKNIQCKNVHGQQLDKLHGQQLDKLHGQQLDKLHGQQLAIELNKEVKKELNNKVIQVASMPSYQHDAVTRKEEVKAASRQDAPRVNNFNFNDDDKDIAAFLAHATDMHNQSKNKAKIEQTDDMYQWPDDNFENYAQGTNDPATINSPEWLKGRTRNKLLNEYGKPMRKRDVINALQKILYARQKDGKPEYQYLGPTFCSDLYESIARNLKSERINYTVNDVIDAASLVIGHIIIGRHSKHKQHFQRCLEHKDASYYLRSQEFTELLRLLGVIEARQKSAPISTKNIEPKALDDMWSTF